MFFQPRVPRDAWTYQPSTSLPTRPLLFSFILLSMRLVSWICHRLKQSAQLDSPTAVAFLWYWPLPRCVSVSFFSTCHPANTPISAEQKSSPFTCPITMALLRSEFVPWPNASVFQCTECSPGLCCLRFIVLCVFSCFHSDIWTRRTISGQPTKSPRDEKSRLEPLSSL